MPARVFQESPASNTDVLSDDNLSRQFTGTTFDPFTFLNNCLPTLSTPLAFTPEQARSRESSLQEVSARTQLLLTKANAQNVRFTSTLSQLTDEILRSGSRLAYEVQVLRGDANALCETLTETLEEDIQKFSRESTKNGGNYTAAEEEKLEGQAVVEDPEFISQLQMLGQVKERLEGVINVFGEAMKWPLPPSELSLTSSLISVSGPEPGSESQSREEMGKEFAKKAKAEIVELLNSDDGHPNVEAAATKVNELRLLSTVWKGTTEEKARNRFVDSLSKLVEDKRRQSEARPSSQPPPTSDTATPRSSSLPGRPATGMARDRPTNETGGGPGGLLRNLQRLRDEIYLD